MDVLEKQEREKYEKMWQLSEYRTFSPGLQLSQLFLDYFKNDIISGDCLTDFGCGTGAIAIPFMEKGLKLELIDIASNALNPEIQALISLFPDQIHFTQRSLWDLPDTLSPSEWIYSTDVLEHIPENKVDAVLDAMMIRTLKGGLIQVFLEDEGFGKAINDSLHLTIKPLSWWIDKINARWQIDAIIPIISTIRYSFFVKGRRR